MVSTGTDHKLEPLQLGEIDEARRRIAGIALRTPLIRLHHDDSEPEIYLKLENLQPIGSFKIRGAANAMAALPRERLAQGVFTASAGNMAQGVAWNARLIDVPCTVVVPDHAPRTKVEAITRLGAEVVAVGFDEWWQVVKTRRFPGLAGLFVHPVSDRMVIAGNATIGWEIHEDLPDVDTVLVPYGGGGLSSGIASALRHLRPEARVYAVEVATAAPLAPSLRAGHPVEVDYHKSFIDGIGSTSLLAEMWPLVSTLLSGSVVVEVEEVAAALRLLVERARIVAEGAGAASLAAALRKEVGGDRVVCVVSGGNIDRAVLARILAEDG